MAPCDAQAEIRRLEAELERCKRAVEWLKDSGVFSVSLSRQYIYGNSGSCDIPAAFAEIISGSQE